MRLVLASSSQRRADLLAALDLEFEVKPADVDETRRPDETPGAYVERVARNKAAAVARYADVLDDLIAARREHP